MANPEGPVSPLVTDSAKYQCSRCNGSKFYISKTLDNFNDVAGATTEAALLLTNAGGKDIQALVGLCVQCGAEQVLWWVIFDVGTTNAGATTMTDLVQATTADLMAGLYGIPMVGTDVEKYFIVSTNTAADPTVITWTVAPNNDSDGLWMITNRLPVGYTVAS
jgi:hypothetical protein